MLEESTGSASSATSPPPPTCVSEHFFSCADTHLNPQHAETNEGIHTPEPHAHFGIAAQAILRCATTSDLGKSQFRLLQAFRLSGQKHGTPVQVQQCQARFTRFRVYSPPEVDRVWSIWGSYYNIPKAIFYLLKGDYRV